MKKQYLFLVAMVVSSVLVAGDGVEVAKLTAVALNDQFKKDNDGKAKIEIAGHVYDDSSGEKHFELVALEYNGHRDFQQDQYKQDWYDEKCNRLVGSKYNAAITQNHSILTSIKSVNDINALRVILYDLAGGDKRFITHYYQGESESCQAKWCGEFDVYFGDMGKCNYCFSKEPVKKLIDEVKTVNLSSLGNIELYDSGVASIQRQFPKMTSILLSNATVYYKR